MIRRSWIAWALVLVAAAGAGFWLARELDSPGPQLASGTWLPQPRDPASFSLVDQDGRPFTGEDLRGRPSLVFFGFTHCPDICPATLAQLVRAREDAGLERLRIVLVSVDPGRDTPEALAKYVRAFDPSLIGLTGEALEIEQLAADFGVAVSRVDLPGGDYTMDHSAAVFLLDAQGRMTGVFTPPFDSARLAEDLRRAAPHLG